MSDTQIKIEHFRKALYRQCTIGHSLRIDFDNTFGPEPPEIVLCGVCMGSGWFGTGPCPLCSGSVVVSQDDLVAHVRANRSLNGGGV